MTDQTYHIEVTVDLGENRGYRFEADLEEGFEIFESMITNQLRITPNPDTTRNWATTEQLQQRPVIWHKYLTGTGWDSVA